MREEGGKGGKGVCRDDKEWSPSIRRTVHFIGAGSEYGLATQVSNSKCHSGNRKLGKQTSKTLSSMCISLQAVAGADLLGVANGA